MGGGRHFGEGAEDSCGEQFGKLLQFPGLFVVGGCVRVVGKDEEKWVRWLYIVTVTRAIDHKGAAPPIQ